MKNILKFLLILLIMWPVYSQSQEPSPSQRGISKQEQKQTNETKKKTYYDQRGTKDAPLIVEVIPTNRTNEPAEQQTDHKQETSFHDKLIAYGTVALAAITALLALFTFRLWKSTGRLVIGAEKTASQQLRAYVFMKIKDEDKLFYDASGCLTAPLIIQNFGQTPAYETVSWLNIGLYEFPLNTKLDEPSYLPTASKSPIAPGDFNPQHIALPGPLRPIEIEAIRDEKAAIFVCGEVIYVDAFKIKQRSNICLFSTGEDFSRGVLAYYHEGNEAT
jgi:hypothetical protein